jgi:2',3'-cyclic-nucleotide 2'-phosphodiesterase (5'-nucleotidase family)/endonuclease/exonuclease/phosphatase family metal-dependent hydrolase
MTIWINEFHYDNDGTDTGEFIEIAGPAGTDLTGWSIVLYNGSNGASYNTVMLSGAAQTNVANGIGFWTVPYPANGIQNGAPDGIALVDNAGTVVEFLSYEGVLIATDGPAVGLTSIDIGQAELGTTPTGFSLQRIGEGRTAADFTAWAAPAVATVAGINTGQIIAPEADSPVSDIVFSDAAAFTLQLFHVADQEAGIAALTDADNFSAVLNALRVQDIDGDGVAGYGATLTLSSGDAYIPGVFNSASQTLFGAPGLADILIQNELGIQAIAFGNHEFDQGTAVINTLISGGTVPNVTIGGQVIDFQGTAFPYLSSNLDFSTDANLAPLVVTSGQAPLAATITKSVVLDAGGEPVGVIGATTPTLRSISSPGGVTVLPTPFGGVPTDAELDALAAIIQTEVDAILATGVNKVILLAHMQQIAIEEALASRLSGVDIIVAGGSNTRLFDADDTQRPGDTVQGTYPKFITGADGNLTALVNTDGNYKYLGRLVVDFDADGNVLPGYDPTISGAYRTDAQGVADLGAENLVDAEIDAITDALEQVIIAQDGTFFGITDVFLNGARSAVRVQETNLGNLTADANLAYAQGIDDTVVLSIKNAGGIRASIGRTEVLPGTTEAAFLPPQGNPLSGRPEGGISQTDIQNALSFNNGLSILDLTREGLVAILEHGVAASSPDDANQQGRFPQVSGLQFSFDLTRAPGDRIVNAVIVDDAGNPIATLVQNGEIVGDPAQTFRVVTLDFLANGGDGYPFGTLATNRVDITDAVSPRVGEAVFAANGSEQDALAEYLDANFSTVAFTEADTARGGDARIQNLAFAPDTVPILTEISDIQGAALVSDMVGDAVVTTGIVTAVDSNGFYLQDATGDGNDATSDAIFVFTGTRPTVVAGDALRVAGTVAEFTPGGAATGNQSTTQLSTITNITLLSQGNALPAATKIGEGGRSIPTSSIDDDTTTFNPANDGLDFFESLEGMRVSVDNLLVTEGTNAFGEVFGVSGPATGLSDRGTLNIAPDDFNPERIQFNFDNGIFAGPAPLVDVGDTVANVTGVLSYAFGNYEILPTQTLGAITDGGLQAETTTVVASATQLTIASYNVLNLDPNDADGDADVADGRFDAIARHIVQNMGTPDILGLQEVQDNSGSANDGTVSASQTLQTLIDAIDRLDDGLVNGTSGYAFVDNTFIVDNASGGEPGGNIRTAYLYNTDRVSLVDGSVRTIGSQAPGGSFEDARLPLVADFTFNGQNVTVINNHFSSKGGSAPILGTVQPFEDLQNDPTVNGSLDQRLAQATAVSYEVSQLLAADANARIAVVGDFNEFEFVQPLQILEGAGLTNLTNTLPENERYSFVFQGNSQSLDHILVSSALAGGAQFDAVHVNAEFAATAQRASDHDPLVAGLTILPPEPETETVTVAFNEVGRGFFGRTVADITIGDATVRERLGFLSFHETLDFANVALNSEGPGLDLLVAQGGTLGISSRGERLSDRGAINADEFLFIDLGGNANSFSADFLQDSGQVELAFFDDGVLVAAGDVMLSGGIAHFDNGAVFDEVRLSATTAAGSLRLEGFTFDRLIFEDEATLVATAQGRVDYGIL